MIMTEQQLHCIPKNVPTTASLTFRNVNNVVSKEYFEGDNCSSLHTSCILFYR